MHITSSLFNSLPDTEDMETWLAMHFSASQDRNDLGTAMARRVIAPQRVDVIDAGLKALAKLRQGQSEVLLTAEESDGLEALVVMIGRPALLIENGRFSSSVPPGWEILEHHRSTIDRVCRSVGRIDLHGHRLYPWVGTGFLVAPNVVMTNRHVAKAFTELSSEGLWVFEAGVTASFDYTEAPDVDPPMTMEITGVIGVHERLDLALLRVVVRDEISVTPPEPLIVASQPPDPQQRRSVYAVGYPARDPRNDPEVMQRIFGDIYGVKRLQPGMSGEVLLDEGMIRHDCSTLGGNSGSCVVDLLTGEVIGLHFRGFYMEYNEAVALGCLANDPLLREAGIWSADASRSDSRLASYRESRFSVD